MSGDERPVSERKRKRRGKKKQQADSAQYPSLSTDATTAKEPSPQPGSKSEKKSGGGGGGKQALRTPVMSRQQIKAEIEAREEALALCKNPVYTAFSGARGMNAYPMPLLHPRVSESTRNEAAKLVELYVRAVVGSFGRFSERETFSADAKAARESLEKYQRDLVENTRTINFLQAKRAARLAYAMVHVDREKTLKEFERLVPSNSSGNNYAEALTSGVLHVYDPAPEPVIGVDNDHYGVCASAAVMDGFSLFMATMNSSKSRAIANTNLDAIISGERLVSRRGPHGRVQVASGVNMRSDSVESVRADADDATAKRLGVRAFVINSNFHATDVDLARALHNRLIRITGEKDSSRAPAVVVTRVPLVNVGDVARELASAHATAKHSGSLSIFYTQYEDDRAGVTLCADLSNGPTAANLAFLAAIYDAELGATNRVKVDQFLKCYEVEPGAPLRTLVQLHSAANAKLLFPKSFCWDHKNEKFMKIGARALQPLVAAARSGKKPSEVTKSEAEAHAADAAVVAEAGGIGAGPKKDSGGKAASTAGKKRRERKQKAKAKEEEKKEEAEAPASAADDDDEKTRDDEPDGASEPVNGDGDGSVNGTDGDGGDQGALSGQDDDAPAEDNGESVFYNEDV